jgi:hypothetical protein
MRFSSIFKTTGFGRGLRVRDVFASGMVVKRAFVGFADIVFLDSPPLAGWASGGIVSFLGFGFCRVTSVTWRQNAIF